MNVNVYQTCYDLINEFIFGNTIVAGTYPDLVAIALSTCATIVVFALPFIIVWRIIRHFL